MTTGRTIEEAKDKALDELGVDELEAEFEIVEEPKAGLFGRVRREAKVRARVAPREPRPKVERRDRNRRGGKSGNTKSGNTKSGNLKSGNGKAGTRSRSAEPKPEPADDDAVVQERSPAKRPSSRPSSRPAAPKGTPKSTPKSKPKAGPSGQGDERDEKGSTMSTVTAQEQAEAAKEFLEGFLDEFGADGTVSIHEIDEEMVELQVEGDDLGLLIGPKGQTLNALQELAKTYVMRTLAGTHEGRIRLDVSGYRQKRREALERFVKQVADEVRESGTAKSLEPMHPADRKVVHDTVNEIEGVRTISEGEDNRRRVVILPDGD